MTALHIASSQADGYADTSAALTEMVIQEIAAALNVAFRDVQPECGLVRDLGATASDLHILRTGLEVSFGLYVPLGHLSTWRTVSDVQTYVRRRMADRQPR